MKKSFTTTIDKNLQEKFKKACKEQEISMAEVLEIFMSDFSEGKYNIINEKKLIQKKI